MCLSPVALLPRNFFVRMSTVIHRTLDRRSTLDRRHTLHRMAAATHRRDPRTQDRLSSSVLELISAVEATSTVCRDACGHRAPRSRSSLRTARTRAEVISEESQMPPNRGKAAIRRSRRFKSPSLRQRVLLRLQFIEKSSKYAPERPISYGLWPRRTLRSVDSGDLRLVLSAEIGFGATRKMSPDYLEFRRNSTGCAGRTGSCAKNARYFQKPRPGSLRRPARRRRGVPIRRG